MKNTLAALAALLLASQVQAASWEPGKHYTELPQAQLMRFREKMKPVIAKHAAGVGEATVQAVMAELEKLRK